MIYVTGDTHANIDIEKPDNMWRLWIVLGWLTQGDVVARLAHSQKFHHSLD